VAGLLVAAGTLGSVGIPADAAPTTPATATPATANAGPATPPPTTPVPVAYDCFVTFPGGDTVVGYGLTFKVSAPTTTRLLLPFKVVLDTPPITPNPSLQSDVRDVAVTFDLPDNALVVAAGLTGGSGLGTTVPKVSVAGGRLTLRAAGPFPAATVFDLPAVNLLMIGFKTGAATTATGGTSYDDPSFTWMRNSRSPGDPPGTLRPFLCQPPVAVTFTSTKVKL
jgi:dehydratase